MMLVCNDCINIFVVKEIETECSLLASLVLVVPEEDCWYSCLTHYHHLDPRRARVHLVPF